MFIIPYEVSLYDVRIEWTGLFRAAVWKDNIYIVEENFDVTNGFEAKSTFIHELTHIFQKDYSIPDRPTSFDADKARSSLKEGDATFMADIFKNHGVIPTSYYSTLNRSCEINLLYSFMALDNILQSLPSSISSFNRFPYRYGIEFVKILFARGGWGGIEKAYGNPPNTTEQVMHPEKYFVNEDTLDVKTILLDTNWDIVKTERFGEFFILVMLNNWISENEAKIAAQGWGGDSLVYYENNEDFQFSWNIRWDSIEDAQEFYMAFQRMMDETHAERLTDYCWIENGRHLSIQLKDQSTLIINSTNETIVQQPFS